MAARGPSPSGDGGIAALPLEMGKRLLDNHRVQTVVLKIKLRTLNRAKVDHLAALADEFTACVRFHWEHASARRGGPPRSIIRQRQGGGRDGWLQRPV